MLKFLGLVAATLSGTIIAFFVAAPFVVLVILWLWQLVFDGGIDSYLDWWVCHLGPDKFAQVACRRGK